MKEGVPEKRNMMNLFEANEKGKEKQTETPVISLWASEEQHG